MDASSREDVAGSSWSGQAGYLSDPAIAPLHAGLRLLLRLVRQGGDPPRKPVCPFWHGVFERSPLAPVPTGLCIALLLILAFSVFDLLEGRWDPFFAGMVGLWDHVELRSAVVTALLLAGIVVTHRIEEVGTTGDLARLLPQLDVGGADAPAVRDDLGRPHPAALLGVGALGAGAVAAIVPFLYLEPTRFLDTDTFFLPSVIFDLGVGAVIGWTLFRTLFAGIVEDVAFAGLSRQVREIDLLDLRPLSPFARRGMRRALRWGLLASIAAFVFVDAGYVEPPAVLFAGIIGVAMTSFLVPVYGIHQRIRDEKQRLLEDLQTQIRRERDRVQREGGRGHLADLLAWEGRIAAARVWPVNTSMLLRLALFLVLPLGSWLGGAFVERLVDAALD